MVSELVSGSSGPGLSLAGDILLCSWARHFTLTVPLSTQVYKWVPENSMLGVTLRWTIVATCYRNRVKLRADGPLGLYANFTFYLPLSNSLIIHAALIQPEHLILVTWMGLETQLKTS